MATQATQDFVPIKEIRDGVVVLKDGTLCIVLMASSLNFALKSADEQQGILMQFQNVLNSLDFSVQILAQSRRLDIKPYILLLEDRYREQTNELLKVQIREYIGFIKNFTEQVSIMTKTFYVVVPFSPISLKASTAGLAGILGGRDASAKREEQRLMFEELRTQLEQRTNVVESGLMRTGIRIAVLGTEELIELFFKMMNPGEIIKPQLQGTSAQQ